nr:hypothetical protein MIMGU_mgv1a016550mg [Ipomoea batatas]GMD95207.1 hypothetical protein MIMGU_mgv1a016550mg [Ipomoea batatas]GME18478.1 hypothetical protein MIMGU_mgv1a016550mg [Ipomoea batatas]
MKYFSITFILLTVLLLHFQQGKSGRILHEEEKLTVKKREVAVLLESLQKGDVPSSGPSGCTQIPGGSGSGSCPLKEMHFAGAGAFPAHPRRLTVPSFGVARG